MIDERKKERWTERWKRFRTPYGKRLSALHRCNAWAVLVLAVSGLVLYIGAIRGELGAVRVWLKELHVWIGLASILLIAAYLPLLRKHWRQLRGKPTRKANLLFVLAILIGWIGSGLLLWQLRHIPPSWANVSLWVHDLLTWVGVPYAVYHSVTRMRWMTRKAAGPAERTENRAPAGEEPALHPARAVIARLKEVPITRKAFLRWFIGLGLVFGLGPSFYRWMKQASLAADDGEATTRLLERNENVMIPDPVPSPDSVLPAGGGARGQFRIYTVTPLPVFTSEDWRFAVSGLVDRPMTWTWEELLALPRRTQVSDFHCVTGWSVYSITWEGIPLSEMLALAGIKSSARYVKMYSGDGVYTDGLSLEQAGMEDVMVAVLMDGKPIPRDLGGPVRLVVPQMYAYKSVKWLQAMELIEKEHFGYWEVRGYENDAWVPKNRLNS